MRMRKGIYLFSLLCLITILGTAVQATVVEFPLTEPFQYEREIGPVLIEHSSPIDLYVANVENPERWKDWEFIVWVPTGSDPVTTIQVDYSNDPAHTTGNELELFDVTLQTYTGEFLPGWEGYYANTWLVDWGQCGTNPVGSGLPHAWGNPAWVSFHFDVEVDPYIYIKDACVPEPATLILLGLGAIALRRR